MCSPLRAVADSPELARPIPGLARIHLGWTDSVELSLPLTRFTRRKPPAGRVSGARAPCPPSGRSRVASRFPPERWRAIRTERRARYRARSYPARSGPPLGPRRFRWGKGDGSEVPLAVAQQAPRHIQGLGSAPTCPRGELCSAASIDVREKPAMPPRSRGAAHRLDCGQVVHGSATARAESGDRSRTRRGNRLRAGRRAPMEAQTAARAA